jgi:hypothetical protein
MESPASSFRGELLRSLGASDECLEALLSYCQSPFETRDLADLRLPLEDEAHIPVWKDYEGQARAEGALPALGQRLVQLRFPIEAGISGAEGYRAATRRGVWPPEDASGLELQRPEGLELRVHETMAGGIPILVVPERADFVALVRALSGRNEPGPVPDSMGACIVSGLNNWDRVSRHRKAFEARRRAGEAGLEWSDEWTRLVPRKELYQDRLIILSTGPYSAARADSVGQEETVWLDVSLAIRREHECTHYLTRRVFGKMRNHVLDELSADFVGLMNAWGRYEARWALLFLGLEDHPRFRRGGRLEMYLGQPPLQGRAVEILRELVVRAVANLEAFVEAHPQRSPEEVARTGLAMMLLSVEELASEEMASRLLARVGAAE